MQVTGVIANGVDAELKMCGFVHFELGDPVGNLRAIDGGGKGFILEFLVDAFGFEVGDAVRSYFGAGDDESGEFIDGEEDFCEVRITGGPGVFGMSEDGAADRFVDAEAAEVFDADEGVLFAGGVFFVIKVVEESGDGVDHQLVGCV